MFIVKLKCMEKISFIRIEKPPFSRRRRKQQGKHFLRKPQKEPNKGRQKAKEKNEIHTVI